jgi:hypothetical protein
MPTTSKKQHKFMEAVAHNPSFAKKVGVPQSVGQDFSNADKGKTFKRGGDMAKANPFMEMIAKKKAMAAGKKPAMPMKKMANGGSASSRADGIATKGKTKGKLLNKGGMAC